MRARTAPVVVNLFRLSELGFNILLFNLVVNLPWFADLYLVVCVLVLLEPTRGEDCIQRNQVAVSRRRMKGCV
jgi:hypothetical protein